MAAMSIAMMIRKPIGNPINGSCARIGGSSLTPRNTSSKVLNIESIERPITPIAIEPKMISILERLSFLAIRQA